jgi:hypothetical protein
MLELQTREPTFESQHAHSETEGTTPKSSLDRWWETPALLPPPPPNPSIYGIDAAEVAIGGLHLGSGSTVVDEVAAQVGEREAPSNLNAMIGMSNVVSAQTGGPSRATLMQQADGDRGLAMNAQMLLAAKAMESVTDKIYVALGAAPDERGPGGVLQQLEALVTEGLQARTKLSLVSNEKFQSRAMRDGMLHVSRAANKFSLAIEEVKKYARSHQLSLGEKTTAIGVRRDVVHLETSMQMVGADTTNIGKVKESETKLENESLRESLDGLLRSSQALMMAVHESAPETAASEVLPALLSNQRLLAASLVEGVKPTSAMRKQGAEIVRLVETAYNTASPQLKANGAMQSANASVPATIVRLEALAKGRK